MVPESLLTLYTGEMIVCSEINNMGRAEKMFWELLLMIWVLNILDLICTIEAHRSNILYEVNPIANILLDCDTYWWIILYKAGLIIGGSTCLILFRSHYSAKLLIGIPFIIYLLVIVNWVFYLDNLIKSLFQ
jgi:hypothetical protein